MLGIKSTFICRRERVTPRHIGAFLDNIAGQGVRARVPSKNSSYDDSLQEASSAKSSHRQARLGGSVCKTKAWQGGGASAIPRACSAPRFAGQFVDPSTIYLLNNRGNRTTGKER